MTTTSDHARLSTAREDAIAGFTAMGAGVTRMPADADSLHDEVIWVDLEADADPIDVRTYLTMLDENLEPSVVDDLLDRDPLARAQTHAGRIHQVSAVGIEVGHGENEEAEPRAVTFQMVEMLAGEGWLVTCWHASERVGDGESCAEADIVLRDEICRTVEAAWSGGNAADLGTLVCARLAAGYRRCYRTLERWLQEWEMAFHTAAEDQRDPDSVRQLLGIVNEARRRLVAFHNTRGDTEGAGWFPSITRHELDKHADKLLDSALNQLRLTFEHVRADIELVAMEKLLEQAKESAKRDEQERRFEKNLAKVTALLLVPTLIAGVFGANTWVPGEHSWLGFGGMVVGMVVTSLTVYLTLVRRDRREERATSPTA